MSPNKQKRAGRVCDGESSSFQVPGEDATGKTGRERLAPRMISVLSSRDAF